MPTLFRTITREHEGKPRIRINDLTEFNIRLKAQAAIRKYSHKLDGMPRKSHFYTEREELCELREKELTHILTNKKTSDSEKRKQIAIFINTLNEGTHLLEGLLQLRGEIDDPKNDLSQQDSFKHHPNKEIRQTAKKYLTCAMEVLEGAHEVAYGLLKQKNFHEGPKALAGLHLASSVVKHTGELLNDPSSEGVQTLLQDQKQLNEKLGSPLWLNLIGPVTAFVGLCLYILGCALISTPAAIPLVAIGGGLMMLGGALTGLRVEKTYGSDLVNDELNALIKKADKLFPKESLSLTGKELKPMPAARRLSLAALGKT